MLRPVAKRSVGKPGRGGRKWAARRLDDDGTAMAEVITTGPAEPDDQARPLLLRSWSAAARSSAGSRWTAARERHRAALAELPVHALQLSRGYPAIPTVFLPDDKESASG